MTSSLVHMAKRHSQWNSLIKYKSTVASLIYQKAFYTSMCYTHAQSVQSMTPLVRNTGSYSQVLKANGTLYISGLLGIDEKTGDFAGESTAEQTLQALKNLKTVLEEGGSSLKHVIKAKILLSSYEDYPLVNQIYGEYFAGEFNIPALACYVKHLPNSAKIEIEAIALEIVPHPSEETEEI
jgi:2-iminobutanoate/2-iminopropanoate deaminase